MKSPTLLQPVGVALRHWRRIYFAAMGALMTLAVVVAFLMYNAMPPSKVVMVAGAQATSYADFAKAYQEYFSRHGVQLEIRYTGGSRDNINALTDPASDAQIGLAVTGMSVNPQGRPIASLGGIARGALWIFYRNDTRLERLSDLAGRRISTGAPGSSVDANARSILTQAGAMNNGTQLVQMTELEAIHAIEHAEIDVMLLPGLPDSQAIRKALSLPNVRLMNVLHAEALALRDPILQTTVLPRGYLDLAIDSPASDIKLLAVSSSILVSRDLHPALQYLLLEAAKSVHRDAGVFQRYGEFPAPQARDLPLSPYAERFYRNGRPFFFDHMPFWAAAFVDRAVWIALPVVAMLVPMMQLGFPAFLWFAGRSVGRCLRELRELEHDIAREPTVSRLPEFQDRLSAIDRHTRSLHVPDGLRTRVFELRSMLDMVQRDLDRIARGAAIAEITDHPAA